MASTAIDPCEIRRRKPNLFGFRSFPTQASTIGLSSPFRVNIRLFLQEFAKISDFSVGGLPTWSTFLLNEEHGAVLPLYTVEETVQFSLSPFCKHCKCVGWGNHFVSKRRYHVIIPAADKWEKPLKGNCLDKRNHLLHGLIHCNGYGHLLSISGIEEGSNYLPQVQIMDLWDRICSILQTRKISMNDALKRRSMELRLLHGVAYGQSWFGKWGYRFGRGSYGVTEDQYNRAIKLLGSLDLNKIVDHFKNNRRGKVIQQIIHSYRDLSETQLVTISDLLQFMLEFKSRAEDTHPNPSSTKNLKCEAETEENPISTSTFVSTLGNNDCRWPPKRLEYAIKVIVDVLKDSREFAMPRKELRDVARQCIGDTGLIDFVLKSINCVAVGDQIVRRSINPSSKLVEFSIHDVAKRAESCTESGVFLSSDAKFDSRWPLQRLEHSAKVVCNILRERKHMIIGKRGMARQELRDLARNFIGDTGLIDFLLKSIDGTVVGNQIIYRSRNPSTKLVEFTSEEVFDRSKVENLVGLSPTLAEEPGFDVDEDVLFLYRNVLFGYPDSDSVSLATRTVLDSKYFVKEWQVMDEVNDHLMTVTCRVLPSFDELETELTRPLPPGEVVVVPPWITIGELKVAAQCALRDTYCVMDRFVVKQIGGLRGIEDGKLLSCTVEPGAQVWVRGCGLDLDTKLRYQGGVRNWTVDCVCGARDEDGERVVTCDGCHVAQHTRCNSIEDDEPAPIFLCMKCRC